MAKDKDEVAVSVDHVTKDFVLSHEGLSSIKSGMVNILKKKKVETEVYHALRGVSFDIKKGEFFGIVGRNGSGKSTLLKIIAEIYRPTSGSVEIKGRLVPFIELGVGFNPELTGRENVYLNGALLGFSQKEMEAMYDDIVKFAELEVFMDQKLKNYSSGMQVRLAFSVAIQADADILLIDEVLAVGDEAFQRKCLAYFAKLKKNKKTVIFVTHSMEAVQQFCDRAIMIEKGKVVSSGNSAKVSQAYREMFIEEVVHSKDTKTESEDAVVDNNAQIHATSLLDIDNNTVKFKVNVTPSRDIEDPIVIFKINRDNGELVYRWASNEKKLNDIHIKKNEKFQLEIEVDNIFPNGVFDVEFAMLNHDKTFNYLFAKNITSFEVINNGSFSGDIYWKPKEKFELK
ncbi:MAG: ABC transporter ATP-binding protein [Candidatus Saccharimonadales bacterium]